MKMKKKTNKITYVIRLSDERNSQRLWNRKLPIQLRLLRKAPCMQILGWDLTPLLSCSWYSCLHLCSFVLIYIDGAIQFSRRIDSCTWRIIRSCTWSSCTLSLVRCMPSFIWWTRLGITIRIFLKGKVRYNCSLPSFVTWQLGYPWKNDE